MKISIFTEAKAHPKSKEEKNTESKKVSKPFLPEIVEIMNDSQLVEYVSQYAWSPFIFSSFRHGSNFVSTDFLTYDIDEGMTIDECEAIVTREKLCCLCLPSPSHTPEAQRFRIILPLARTITSISVYEETWKKGAEIFGVVDEQCKDSARYYFACTTDDGFWIEGDFFSPVLPKAPERSEHVPSQTTMIVVTEDLNQLVEQIYGEKREKIPEAVDFFLRNAGTGLPGKWTNSLNSCCFSLALSGVDDGIIEQVIEQLAPLPLDGKDLYQIKRAIRDGKAAI